MSDRENQGKIIKLPIQIELKDSYLTYAMSVIVSRALPDVRDGLKPVHRRILYAMNQTGMHADRPYKKSATIVGEVLGKYHPHGDAALYGAMVRMAQKFSMRYPLVDGQGNYGSVDGDPPAAMRYTECRMTTIASEMLQDIDKQTVDQQLNYDDSKYEPIVLPSALPNLLLNGSSGIAVGMATNIPPHNLIELVDSLCLLIDNPDSTIDDLMQHIHGPDFPTAGIICGSEGIRLAYHTGRGKITIRARVEIEERKPGLDNLVIYELPYQVNKAELLSKIAMLSKEKRVEGIFEIRDESDRNGMRAVIELKRNTNAKMILNQLYAHTQLQNVFGIIMLALSPDKQPKVMNLKEILESYVAHRKEVLIRKSIFELKKAERRAHMIEGLLKALDRIDFVISLIRSSQSVEDARNSLIKALELSEEQAQSILDMKLQRLTSLENEKLKTEYNQLKEQIEEIRVLLADDAKQFMTIKEQLLRIRDTYKDERRTEISQSDGFIQNEDLIPVEDHVVILTHHGYMNRMPLDAYRKQKRGGLGVAGSRMKEDDLIQNMFAASTHDYVMFFSDRGRVFFVKVYELPFGDRTARGRHVRMLLDLDSEEKIKTVLAVEKLKSDKPVVLTTRYGIVKRCRISDFIHARARGIRAMRLDEGDELISAMLTDGASDLVFCTEKGRALRIKETSVRIMQRAARGVFGIRLTKGNKVIGVEKVDENKCLLVVSEHGYGKRMEFDEMAVHHRATQGQIYMRITPKTGRVVTVQSVFKDDQVILMTAKGKGLKTSVADISKFGRNAGGVRLINLKESDNTVVAVSAFQEETDEVAENNTIIPETIIPESNDTIT